MRGSRLPGCGLPMQSEVEPAPIVGWDLAAPRGLQCRQPRERLAPTHAPGSGHVGAAGRCGRMRRGDRRAHRRGRHNQPRHRHHTEQLPKGRGRRERRRTEMSISGGASVLPASAGMARSHSPAWAPDCTEAGEDRDRTCQVRERPVSANHGT